MPVLFISYSHDSEAHRDQVAALAQRLRVDGFDVRLDQFLNGGPDEGWHRWMLDQLDAADFVLLVCSETYYRRFRGHEVPGKGKGVDFEGSLITLEIYHARSKTLKFVPILFSEADESFIPEPLRGHNHYSPLSKRGYDELCDFLKGQAGVEPAPVGKLELRPRRQVAPLSFSGDPRIAPSRLSHTADKLFGRDADLARLARTWKERKVRLLTLVAFGGVGKTSLVGRWAGELSGRGFDGADYFDWSFYSQGTRDHSTASGDAFIDSALRFFGDEAMADSARDGWSKGARLAEILGSRRALLVLDGLEPLQYPPGPLAGELRDPAMTALLRGLAARNAGLCVVTTREKLAELGRWPAAEEWELESLDTPAGVDLLKSLGVDGSTKELAEAVEEVQGHALTLNLLARFLHDAHGGDVRKRKLVGFREADAEIRGGHAFRVMGAYEHWLEAGGIQGRLDLAVLRLLGLFDRPASAECLEVLLEAPAIRGLTDAFFEKERGFWGWLRPAKPLAVQRWKLALARLQRVNLVVPGEDGSLDAHPLIREYFADQLRRQDREAWRAAHGRIFDYLKDSTAKFPDTLPGLQPLYQAVYHGCQAGKQQQACVEVYRDRILRGRDFYSTSKLGAFGADLGAVACFFEQPWSRVSSSLSEADQAWLLNEAATRLRALGRLREAVEPMRAGVQSFRTRQDWKSAAGMASNLSELELTLGEVPAAVADAEQSVLFADRSGDAFLRMARRTTEADSRHQAGEKGAALALFREAERQQAERQPQYPLLYSLWSFRYCDLLLAPAERAAWSGRGEDAPAAALACAEVERRATQTLPIAQRNNWVLDIALDHLSLGRARLYRAILEGRAAEVATEAGDAIEEAVAGLRAAGTLDYLPRGLLTRSWLRYATGNPDGARADLDEAWDIAERGSMRLHLADVALYRARFFGERALAEARRLAVECGYRRRLPEIEALEAAAVAGDS